MSSTSSVQGNITKTTTPRQGAAQIRVGDSFKSADVADRCSVSGYSCPFLYVVARRSFSSVTSPPLPAAPLLLLLPFCPHLGACFRLLTGQPDKRHVPSFALMPQCSYKSLYYQYTSEAVVHKSRKINSDRQADSMFWMNS